MKHLLNNLYVTTDGSYIRKERETLVVEQDQQKVLQLPFHSLHNVFCFGRVMVTPDLMAKLGETGIGLSFFTGYGKFQSRLQGPQSGNVLLRRAQYRRADADPESLTRLFLGAKLSNARYVVMKHQRNHDESEELTNTANHLKRSLVQLKHSQTVDAMRGIEGDAAARYFSTFNHLIVDSQSKQFSFNGRTKRPPLDEINALLSFSYSLLTHEIASAMQGVGLDPHVGFLHKDRPGRLSLALDMLEEFRAWWCDRLTISLINRKQINASDFTIEASGAVRLSTEARKRFLTAWQERKQEEIIHPYTGEKIPIGLLPHVQSQLLARYLRSDIEIYPPFFVK